jgi:hypothetical protein
MYADKAGAIERATFAQEAWNRLAQARKRETGTGFYLDQQQYKQVTQE